MNDVIYKIVPEALWRRAEVDGRFTGSPVDARDGYIHFSTAAQRNREPDFAGAADLCWVPSPSTSSA